MAVETRAEEGLALNTYEQGKASVMVAVTLAAQPYLAKVNQMLEEAEEPMPAIGGSVSTVPGTDLPRVYLGYGQTEPGKGLQPLTDVQLIKGRVVKYGLALPMDPATQRSVTFSPSADGKPSETGWWQQWRPDQFSMHKPGKAVRVQEYPDHDVAFNSESFATWPIPGMPDIPSVPIEANPNHAQNAAGNILLHVRGGSSDIRRRLIVVGGEAVQAALNVLREQPEHSHLTPVPEPLVEMLETVTTDLRISN